MESKLLDKKLKILIIGTVDTKSDEIKFMYECIENLNSKQLMYAENDVKYLPKIYIFLIQQMTV